MIKAPNGDLPETAFELSLVRTCNGETSSQGQSRFVCFTVTAIGDPASLRRHSVRVGRVAKSYNYRSPRRTLGRLKPVGEPAAVSLPGPRDSRFWHIYPGRVTRPPRGRGPSTHQTWSIMQTARVSTRIIHSTIGCATALVLCGAPSALAQEKQKIAYKVTAENSKYTQRNTID